MKDPVKSFAHRLQNERPIFCFEVLSDLHIRLPMQNKKLENALEDIWARRHRMLAILGDLSSDGFMFQLAQCLKQLKEFPNQYLIALGNHDTYSWIEKNQIHIHPLYKELALHHHEQIYYEEVIHGYHFFVLNSERPDQSNAYYSRQQLFWLKEQLAKTDSTKPVFILCHHPLKNTHRHSDEKELSMGIQNLDLFKILKTHPHVVFFSGHIHNSYEECKIHIDESLFEIDVPSFSNTQYGEKRKEIGYQIALYHDFLYVKTRDYKRHVWILSHEYIVDFKQHLCYRFDGSLVQTPQQK